MESLESRQMASCDVIPNGVCGVEDLVEILHQGTRYWGPDSDGFDVNSDGIFNYGDVNDVWEEAGVQKGDVNMDGQLDNADYKILFNEFPEVNLRVIMNFYASAEIMSDDWFKWDEAQSRYQFYDSPLDNLLNAIGVDLLSLRGEDNRNPTAQAFSYADGDVNLDGVFDSGDFIALGQAGAIPDVDTGEIVRIFQLGTYRG